MELAESKFFAESPKMGLKIGTFDSRILLLAFELHVEEMSKAVLEVMM